MMSKLAQDKLDGVWGLSVDNQVITMMNKLLFVFFQLARVHLAMGQRSSSGGTAAQTMSVT